MRSRSASLAGLVCLLAMLAAAPCGAAWRSSLYPSDWTPGYADCTGRFLHDFSYAGYHRGEAGIPGSPPGLTYDVTQPPYGADATGTTDATAAIQQALLDAGSAGGGVVYLPPGTYRVKPPAAQDYALRIWDSGVVLRGAGPDQTFIFNDETFMRDKSVVLVRPVTGGWFAPLSASEVAVTTDIDGPTRTIAVADTSGFAVGEWVMLRTDATAAFIADHGMTGKWNGNVRGISYYRQLNAVDHVGKTLTVDIPTRYYMKTRDNARVYRVAPHIEESGIEHLAIGMRENPKPGLGTNDYDVEGTAGYEVHGSHAIIYYHVVNGWIRDVQTYRPAVNTNDWHVASNIILLSESRSVTVRDCVVERPQYEGGGGNGYGYTLRGSDNLIIDSTASHARHNYDFQKMWASGNVISRCSALTGHHSSDFHMHLSTANLLDHMYLDGDDLEAVYRPYTSQVHGHTTTESVFWNTYGAGGASQAVESRQWGWGYVIGTQGPVSNVVLGTSDNTSPNDFLEGEGQGATLEPQSLYEDQLARRLGLLPSGTPTPTPTTTPFATCTPPPAPGPSATPADTTAAVRCQRAIAREASKFVKAKVQALQKCHAGILKSQDPSADPGVGARTTHCLTADRKTMEKIAKASSKFYSKTAKRCGGADRTCGTVDLPPEEAPVALGFEATCPGLSGSATPECSAPMVDCDDLAACIECIAGEAVDQTMMLYYDSMVKTDPSESKDLNQCQRTIGKETTKYLLAKEKLLAKCGDARVKGRHTDSCPDVTAPVGSIARKTAEKIAAAESRKIVAICKRCGGPSGTCDATVELFNPGGAASIAGLPSCDDFSPGEIGFPPSCADVTAPSVPNRAAAHCGGAVTTLADLIQCVDCVTELEVDCIDAAARPQDGYPCECR